MPGGGYLFPSSVEAIALGVPGLSGSSTALSARAVSSHPGKPIGFFGSLLPRWWQASPFLGGWPSCISVTRPKRVRLRYGSRVRRTGLQRRDYSRSLPDCLHGERAIAMVTSFQVTRSVRLFLTHQKHTKSHKKKEIFLTQSRRDRRDLISWNNQKPTHSAFSFKNPLDFINLSLNIKSVFLSDGYFRFCQRGRNHDLYPCFESWGSWCEEPG